MIKRFFTTCIFVVAIAVSLAAQSKQELKYVFLFIGDGMGVNQVYLTQKFNEATGGKNLVFLDHSWTFGLSRTECADTNKITDSGAGGTAIACGKRTKYGSIGEYKGEPLFSMAYDLKKNKQFKVGILTSVPINHATPACFYGHEPTRYNYDNLTKDLLSSGFDFYAGGGFLLGNQDTSKNIYKSVGQVLSDLTLNKFNLLLNTNNLDAQKASLHLPLVVMDTVLRNQQYRVKESDGEEKNSFPFVLDRPETMNWLANYTSLATDLLYNPTGFFIMTEGGKIDWACHSNDALTAIYEVNAFNLAIEKAYQFYKQHPDNTLIVITADHETGGLALGLGYKDYGAQRANSYALFVTKLMEQKKSHIFTDSAAMHKALLDAQIGWTTNEHTSAPVGVWAIGVGSQEFSGIMRNEEIKEKMLKYVVK